MLTINEALQKGASFLFDKKESQLSIEVIFAHVLGKSREWLLAHGDEVLEESVWDTLIENVKLFASGVPVAHITNLKEFYALDFYVDNRVLIPRPETEMLVDEVLNVVQKNSSKNLRILELGTGSGNIAVSLAKTMSELEIVATDVSAEALEVAKMNAEKHGVEKSIKFVQSDLLMEFMNDEFDVIVANLPYIGTEKYNFVAKETYNNEPHVALFGGENGLFLYKKMFQQVFERSINYSFILGEFGFLQTEEMSDLLTKYFDQNFVIKRDLAGIDRIFIVNS